MTTVNPLVRERLADIVAGVDPFDVVEAAHRQEVLDWIRSGAELYRVRKPDHPPRHLVAYFVVVDPMADTLLLVDHVASGLRLPPGGHCEPGETPWQAVERECLEELGIPATATTWLGPRPLFLTVTQTRDPHGVLGVHTDVTTWHLVEAQAASIVAFDRGEFDAIHWLAPPDVLATPIAQLDPHLHRFIRKYLATRGV